MPTDQYHESPAELEDDARTFARLIASLQEEAEAIGWYEQASEMPVPSFRLFARPMRLEERSVRGLSFLDNGKAVG